MINNEFNTAYRHIPWKSMIKAEFVDDVQRELETQHALDPSIDVDTRKNIGSSKDIVVEN
ncbi:hypothetical protein HPULCUR_007369 [Helicostylum pulchrum]|uniref:Uncharacterized protein n=1 Tax=Helicostylum pulchrum TaxID=562976 RepID=A0ABP9Y4L6_9FUNG